MILNENNNNIKNEQIFWQIIKNKFLFKLILYFIRNQSIYYTDINKVYCGNRKPFEAITSLHWLVVTRQYPLLLDKLKSDQYIHIDTMSINLFIERCFNKSIIELLLEKKYLQLSIIDLIKTSIKNKNLIALSILLEKRIKGNRYISHIDGCATTNKKYFLPIYPSTITTIIQSSNVDIFELVLDHLDSEEINLLIEPIKNELLYKSLTNKYYKEEMILFILNNEILNMVNYLKNQQQQQQLENSNYNNKNSNNNNNNIYIPFSDYLSFKSIKLKNQLLDLNIIEIPNQESSLSSLYLSIEKNIINYSIEELELILRVQNIILDGINNTNSFDNSNNCNNCNNCNNSNNFNNNNLDDKLLKKELIKKIIIQFQSYDNILYLNYLYYYNEIIENYKDNIIYFYTFHYFDINSLNYLIKKYNNNNNNNNNNKDLFQDFKFSNSTFNQFLNSVKLKTEQKEIQIKEFIQLYFNNINNDSSNNVIIFKEWNQIIEILLSKFEISVNLLEYIRSLNVLPISSFIENKNIKVVPFSKYKWYIELIKSNYNIYESKKQYFNKFNNKIPPLSQNEVIDFVLDNKEFYQLFEESNGTTLVDLTDSFKTLDNIKYFINKLSIQGNNSFINNKLIKPEIYIKPFFRALSTSDIPSLIYLESIISSSNNNGKIIIENYQIGNICSKENINNLLEYLNERGFKLMFTESLFFDFIDDLFFQFDDSIIKDLKINFNQFPKQTIKLLYRYIQRFRLPLIKSIILQLDFNQLFKKSNNNNQEYEEIIELINSILNDIKLSIVSNISSSSFSLKASAYGGGLQFKNLFSIIYFLILKIPKEYHKIFESTFNYLFKVILMVDISLEEIKELVELFQKNNIEIQQSLFHLLYYLNAKNPILSNYLLKSTAIQIYCTDPRINNQSSRYQDIDERNIQAIQELSSLDLIQQSSVGELLIKLKSMIMDKYLFNQDSAYYFLTVNQFDLFLEITSTIKDTDVPSLIKIEISLVNYLDKDSLKKLLDSNLIYTRNNQNKKQLLLSFLKYSRLDLVKTLLDYESSKKLINDINNKYNNNIIDITNDNQLLTRQKDQDQDQEDQEDQDQEAQLDVKELFTSSISRQLIIELIRDYKFDTIKYLSNYSDQLFKSIGEVEFVLCFAVGHIEMFEFLSNKYQGLNFKIDKQSVQTAISNYKPFIILYFLNRITDKQLVLNLFKDHHDFKYLIV